MTGGDMGRTLGGVIPHKVVGQIGGISKLLEQIACMLPFTHLQLHAASAALPAVSSKPTKRTAKGAMIKWVLIGRTILKLLSTHMFLSYLIPNFSLTLASDVPAAFTSNELDTNLGRTYNR